MLISLLFLVLGFALLVWGADRFVDGACAVAQRLGVPAVVVGLTVVALGTSAPELSVSVTAALRAANGIAVGNVIGSNMFNLLVVVGVSALIAPMGVDEDILRRDMPLSGGITALLMALLLIGGGVIGRLDGVLLLALMVGYMSYLVWSALRGRAPAGEEEEQLPVWKIVLWLAVGLASIVYGGDLTVEAATDIARILGMSETLIGLTVIALGTSLPELVTSIAAARRGESGLALGNAIGSNIFNLLLILGVSSAICPIAIGTGIAVDLAVLLAVHVVFWSVFRQQKRITRLSGLAMLLIYAVYTGYIILR